MSRKNTIIESVTPGEKRGGKKTVIGDEREGRRPREATRTHAYSRGRNTNASMWRKEKKKRIQGCVTYVMHLCVNGNLTHLISHRKFHELDLGLPRFLSHRQPILPERYIYYMFVRDYVSDGLIFDRFRDTGSPSSRAGEIRLGTGL